MAIKRLLGKTLPLALLALSFYLWGGPAQALDDDIIGSVNPFIGSGGHGHTYPGATLPFGLVQLSPDTGIKDWDWCSGYHDTDKRILGFSHTHLSGTGCGDLGDVLFAPIAGDPLPAMKNDLPGKTAYAAPFSHKNEIATPGYYAVKLDRDGGIFAELTASERVGMHRYTFAQCGDKQVPAQIIVDLTHGISDESIELELKVVGDRKITGLRRSKGWAKDQYVYFAAEFSQPFTAFGTSVDNNGVQAGVRENGGKNLRAYFTFDQLNGKTLLAKVALSTTSVAGAERNLAFEMPDWDFEAVRVEAAKRWRDSLSSIVVHSSNQKDRETFYTALYHSMLAPTLISDVDGQYRGSDHQVHGETKYATYSTFSLWDTFRAEHPLLTIVKPDLINAFITSILHQGQFDKDKTLAIWPLYGCETYCMIGYHSFPVIAEAYNKGFRDWDAKAVLDLMLMNSKRNDWWAKKGYIPADKEDQSVSKTLEFAFDDSALSRFALALGDKTTGDKFARRALSYKNLFDTKIGFVRGRMSDGGWRTPFDPGNSKPGALHDFTEGSAWQYTFFVPQDISGLVAELGGREAFIKKLDELFDRASIEQSDAVQDVTGAIGQYAHGNEPSHHIAYLYDYAGAPAKTQQRVKQIRDRLYSNTLDGLCGNEDCGQMSAWYVFSALGFYPVNPVSGEYALGVPLFPRADIKLPGGKTFTIEADQSKKYVDQVLLNGQPLSRTYITHDEIIKGGKLRFVMSDQAGSKWGSAPEGVPLR